MIILHVGLPKTGTTFLQEEIFRKMNIKYIRDLNITSFATSDRKVIISHEGLSISDVFEPAYKKYMVAEYLKKIFPDAKIIVGIRDKDSWLRSMYSQYIRNGGGGSYDYFISHLDKEHLNFEKYINHLKMLFNDVFVYKFEEIVSDKARVVKEMCDFIGEPVPDYRDKKYRVSLKPYQLRALRFFNRILPYNVNRVFRYVVNMTSNSQPQEEVR